MAVVGRSDAWHRITERSHGTNPSEHGNGQLQRLRIMKRPRFMRNHLLGIGSSTLVLFLSVGVLAGERTPDEAATANEEAIELFDAIDAGLVDVKFIPRNDKQARILVENKTDQPLDVRLPDAFAGVPVLAQGGFGGGGGGGGGGQGVGGGGGGQGGGNFNIPPEKVGNIKVATVCLEHGKPNPRPAMEYEIRRLETFTTRPAVRELLEMLGRGDVDRRVAQVAAWHLNNEMSWEELAAKEIHRANGQRYPYFSQQELKTAMAVVKHAQQVAAEKEPVVTSPGDSPQPVE